MIRRSLAVVALMVVPLIAIPIALAPAASAATPAPIQGCLNSGWQTFTDASGKPFANQGLCIAFAIHHPVSLADLASSSVSGAFSVTDCPGLVGVSFGTTFSASSAVGTARLQTEGCVPVGTPGFPFVFSYPGTFTITTNVGTLSGTVSGQINNMLVFVGTSPTVAPVSAGLALTATSGTGLFTGTTGTLNVSIQFDGLSSLGFVGSISTS